MAAPNLVSPTTMTLKSAGQAVGITATAILTNAAASGKVLKVSALTITNVDGVNNADITVDLFKGGVTAYHLASTITVPADTAMVVLTKDNGVYLEEGDSLRLTASAAGDLEGVVTYEEIS